MGDYESYLRYHRQLTEASIKNYLYLLTQFKKFLLQDIFKKGDLNNATRQDISNFLESLRDKHSISSISLYIIALRSYYKWAYYFYNEKNLQEVSFFLNEIVKTKRVRRIIAVPTREEVFKLRSVLNQFLQLNSWNKNGRQYRDTLRAYAIIELLVTSGLRSKEIMNLQRADVNLEERTLFIRSGKGGHQRLSLFGESAIKLLEEYFELNEFSSNERIFPTSQYNVIYRIVKLWSAKAQINPRIHTHSFRHYFLTESLNQGVKLQDAADQVGHVDLNTTRNYIHRNIKHLKSAYHKVVV